MKNPFKKIADKLEEEIKERGDEFTARKAAILFREAGAAMEEWIKGKRLDIAASAKIVDDE